MVASTSVKDHLTVQYSLFKSTVSLNCALSGASITRSVQLPYFRAKSRVLLRNAFPAKITVSRSLLCLLGRFLFRSRFEDEFDSALRNFHFFADEKNARDSSCCIFSSELLLSA